MLLLGLRTAAVGAPTLAAPAGDESAVMKRSALCTICDAADSTEPACCSDVAGSSSWRRGPPADPDSTCGKGVSSVGQVQQAGVRLP